MGRESSNDSWPRALPLDTPHHGPIPICLGVIALTHQLITLGQYLPLPIQLVSGHPGETSLLHLPTWLRPPHLYQLNLLLLCGLPLVVILAILPHLHVQPGLSYLLVQPGQPLLTAWLVLHLSSQPDLLLLLIQFCLPLVRPDIAHWLDPACLLTLLCSAHLCAHAGLVHLLACPDLSLFQEG